MSGAAEAFSSFDFGSITEFAQDIGSVVTDFGTEFMSAIPSLDAFQIPSFDVSSLGGFDIAGSFAGNADWFNTFNPGSILDSIPSISDFNISSLTSSLPSLSSIKDITSTVTSGLGGITSTLQSVSSVVNKVAPTVNAASSALGIQNPLTSITQAVNQATGIAGTAAGLTGTATGVLTSLGNLNTNNLVSSGAAALGINPSTVSTVTKGISSASNVDAYGLNILNAAETAQLTKNINPAFVNSLTDAGQRAQEQVLGKLSAGNLPVGSDAFPTPAENLASLREAGFGPAPVTAEEQANEDAIARIEANRANPVGSDAFPTPAENLASLREAGFGPAPVTAEEQANEDAIARIEANRANPVNLSNQESQYTSAYDPETGTWSVYDNLTSTTVRQGLSESEATIAEQDLNIESGLTLTTTATTDDDPFEAARLAAEEQSNRTPTLSPEELAASPYVIATTTPNTVVGTPGTLTNINVTNLVQQARQQQTLRNLTQTKAQRTDWRVKLRLAPNSTYLYNDPNGAGILDPLSAKNGTDGVIFPYTPAIETAYKANYTTYDLTHSNFRGYFYQGSYVDAINLRCTFTAQDTNEANYLLAVIHFFRSVTKMFYGKDTERGSPPPLVFLSGLGDYQFNEHPCVVSQFNYSLPPDVDYIRARSTLDMSTSLLNNRTRTSIPGNPLSYGINRLLSSGLFQGATPSPATVGNLPAESPTYVPTKMEIALTLFPIQSRQQVSTQFSLKGFANGNLLKGGFW